MEVRASSVIEAVIPEFDDIEVFYKKIPRGVYIYDGTEEDRLYKIKDKAESKIMMVADAVDVKWTVVWQAALMARRWYNRTGWQRILTDNNAEAIWKLAVKNAKK